MLKKERLMSILKLVDQNEIVTVNDLVETLNVSDMTIRRDLDELSKSSAAQICLLQRCLLSLLGF